MRGNRAELWKMTPTPRSRAGRSVTSLPWRIMLPLSGCSSPAMMRKIVVFPDPEAPNNTKASPMPTSKLTSSSTRVFLKLLLTPRTLAATSSAAVSSRDSPSAPASAPRASSELSVACFGIIPGFASLLASLAFQPAPRAEAPDEDDEGEERQDDCDGGRGLDLPLVEL